VGDPQVREDLPDDRELQRLEHQLPRVVVPRRLQLGRDAAVTPQPQARLREGRAAMNWN